VQAFAAGVLRGLPERPEAGTGAPSERQVPDDPEMEVRFTLVRGDRDEGYGPVADLQLARDELERPDIAAVPLDRVSHARPL
jgi:hypothetical protein